MATRGDAPHVEPPTRGASAAAADAAFDSLPELAWLCASDGSCYRLSRRWVEYTGAASQDLLGRGWLEYLHPDDRAPVAAAWETAVARQEPYELDYRLRRHDGAYRWFHARSAPVVDSSGAVVGHCGVTVDVDDARRDAETALRDSEGQARRQLAEIQTLYDTAPVGLCLLDTELRWVRLNDRMAEMNGLPVAAHLGRTPRELLPDIGAQAEAALRKVLDTGRTLELEITGTTAAQPGVVRAWSERWAPVRDAEGRTVGVSVVAEEITERRQTERALRQSDERSRRTAEELRAAKEMLEQVNRRKDEFLGLLSHELRGPLAAIRNSLYILERLDLGSEMAARSRDVIARQAQLMARLVDDLLDVTRISRGKLHLERQHVELATLVRGAAEDHRPAFAAKDVALELEVPPTPLHVVGDSARLAQVVGNLLTNAAKFTDFGGHVRLRLSADAGSHAVLTLRDDGAGIAPEALDRVFEAYVQEPETRDRSHGGLGLGLALVKGLVEMHGGTVTAASEGLGRGAELTIRLPLAPGPAGD